MHHCSNSANPAFMYSPLLNEQHFHRRSRLQENDIFNLTRIRECNAAEIEQRVKPYLLNNGTLINEKIWVNALLIKNKGTCQSTEPYRCVFLVIIEYVKTCFHITYMVGFQNIQVVC
jgi:hypothetical protein